MSLWFVIQKKIYNSQGKTNHYDRRKSVLRLSCELQNSCNFAAKLNTSRYWSATIRLQYGFTSSYRDLAAALQTKRFLKKRWILLQSQSNRNSDLKQALDAEKNLLTNHFYRYYPYMEFTQYAYKEDLFVTCSIKRLQSDITKHLSFYRLKEAFIQDLLL